MTCLFLAWFFWTISIETLASYNGMGSSSWGLKWNNKKCWWAHSDQEKHHSTHFTSTVSPSLLKHSNCPTEGKSPKATRSPKWMKISFLQGEKRGFCSTAIVILPQGREIPLPPYYSHLSPQALLRRVSAGKSFLLLMLNLKTHKNLYISHLKMPFDNFSMISSRMGIQEDC